MKKYIWIVSAMLVVALILSACGATGSGGDQPTAPSGGDQQAVTPTTAGGEQQQAAPPPPSGNSSESSGSAESGLAKELSVYNWADYIDESLLENYEKEYGVKITYDTYASNEDLLAKLQAGATGYDVIVPSDYMVAQMIELGLLAEIDHNNIPNLKNIAKFNLDPPYDPGNKHCMPYQWGTTGIAYKVDTFKDSPPDSWAYLFDPEMAQKWAEAGGINLLDDQREVIGAALKYLGYSLNDKDEAHLQQAKEVVQKIKPYIKTFNSTDYKNSLLIPGEVVISQAWSGDAALAISETTDEATGESQWAYAIPKEGSVAWQDNLCVTATSQRKATAEHFLNYLLDAENGAAISNYTFYASPNEAAKEFISEEITGDPGVYPPQEVLDKLEWIEPLGESVFLYDQIWTEIKSQ